MSEPPFLTLASELKQDIFMQLPDVSSLLSVILTCSSFHCTFLNAESLLLNTILERKTHPSAAFDALAAFQASELGSTNQTWSKKAVREIMSAYDGDRIASWSRSWRLSDAIKFERMNNTVKYFTDQYVSTTLAMKLVGTNPDALHMPASFSEIGRIQRTFYRFELFCNLFRKRKPMPSRRASRQLFSINPVELFDEEEQYWIFFDRFPAWENEQLGCIHDFLEGRFGEHLWDVKNHAIEWGVHNAAWFDRLNVENYLTLGLTYLQRVITAPTYEVRFDAIDKARTSRSLSLGKSLTHAPDQPLNPGRVAVAPNACDSDSGPKDVYIWAHSNSPPSYYIGHTSTDYFIDDIQCEYPRLRQYGYVMWDHRRLEEWGLLNLAFQQWSDQSNCQMSEEEDSSQDVPEITLHVSIQARCRIFYAGGRGWWVQGDESKIVWPGGKAPDGWMSS